MSCPRRAASLTVSLAIVAGCQPRQAEPTPLAPSTKPAAAEAEPSSDAAPEGPVSDRSDGFCCTPRDRQCYVMRSEEARFACRDLEGLILDCPYDPSCDWDSGACTCAE